MPTTPAAPPDAFRARLAELVARFDRHRDQYLKASYNETEARAEFIDPLFEALGWDVRNTAGVGPTEREVIRESGRTVGRVDYAFRVKAQPRFFVEAKAPHVPLERSDVIMQAKSYAWNTKDVFVAAVTDFEEFRLYDASLKPDPKHPDAGLIFAYRYADYLTPAALGHLWELSREAVRAGSLDRLLKLTAREKRQRIPVDQAFLADLTEWREQLAKAVYKAQPGMDAADLNSAVQVFLDRLIFIRIAEDRGVLPPRGLKEIVEAWGYSGKRRPLTGDLNALFREVNDRLNGEIFKPHHSEKIAWDAPPLAALVAGIIAGLYFPNCPYRFDVIGVELLGSIYERYLGKTIRVTEKRAIVEDKPEVRKAGGVYYTPRYIVDYIVAQTVGKLSEGKTPAQIAKLKILDPACGSGSFLLGAYQCLLDYHLKYYTARAEGKRKEGQPALVADADSGEVRLTLAQKAEILRNNLYGVDIDPQAVEITTMSLYIKLLEGERGAITSTGVLPRLGENIKCGNSLISTLTPGPSPVGKSPDRGGVPIHPPPFASQTGEGWGGGQLSLLPSADLSHLRPFNWESEREGFGPIMKAGGFDAVIGNPPYIRIQTTGSEEIAYYNSHYQTAIGNYDIYCLFVERGTKLLKPDGGLGYILPHRFFKTDYGEGLRTFIVEKHNLQQIIDFDGYMVFDQASINTCVLILAKNTGKYFLFGQVHSVKERGEEIASLLSRVEERDFSSAKFTAGPVSVSILSPEPWVFIWEREKPVWDKLNLVSQRLSGVTTHIFQGLKTSADGIYIGEFVKERGKTVIIHCEADGDDHEIEAAIMKPLIKGGQMRRYHVAESIKRILFPYEGGKLITVERMKQDFPKAWAFLLSHKTYLENREDGKMKGHQWYAYGRRQALNTMGLAKIVTPDYYAHASYCLDVEGKYYFCGGGAGGYGIVVKADFNPKYVLGLLNSRLLDWYLHKITLRAYQTAYMYVRKYIEQLPIRPINFSDPADKARHDRMVGLVEHMLELHRRKAEAKSESQRAQLEREINVTDEQIDGLVYELYGLTEEEVRVVEGR